MAWSDMLGGMKNQLDSVKGQFSSKIPNVQGPEFPDVSHITSSDVSQTISQATDGNINVNTTTIDSIKSFAKGMKLNLPDSKIETPGRSVNIGGMQFDIKSVGINESGIDLNAADVSLNQGHGDALMEQFTGGKSMQDIQNMNFDNMSPEEQQAKIDQIMNQQNQGMDINNVGDNMKPKFDKGTQQIIDMFTKGKGLKG